MKHVSITPEVDTVAQSVLKTDSSSPSISEHAAGYSGDYSHRDRFGTGGEMKNVSWGDSPAFSPAGRR